ncbi:hypothetical protein [Methylobacterium durans]|uniref:Uncharacterized protein n=1 Tax=Methylobacterium durans TaxID=2202825 RepID=A0A2U8W2G5_9HYPH|nr:hypothetical protein [Methylobacterium durans]AWN39700.1 hypothetical protein DK389_03055 [Methylobacterium durans]
MSLSQRKLKIALNPKLVDKNTTKKKSLFAEGWYNAEVSVDEFTAATTQHGWAYCAQLHGRRKGENFQACNIASVDVDHGPTIEEALASPLIQQHALLIYTTARHKPEAHRFRVVYLLPETITCPKRMRKLNRGLTRSLGGDMAATDAARISFGNSKAQVHHIGGELSPALLRELIADAALPDNTDLTMKEIVSRRSAITLARNQVLRAADGRQLLLCEVQQKTAVHCPVHPDENPSAVTLQSGRGVWGVYCSTCRKTYWPADQRQPECDPEAFVRAAQEVANAGNAAQIELCDWPYQSVVDREAITGCRVHIVSGQAAPPELLPGITLVRSGKGTSKTEALKRLGAGANSVLLFGHRRTLIRGSCRRLNLTCYLDLNKKAAKAGSKQAADTASLESFFWREEDVG